LNERIIAIRKSERHNLSQEAFAKKLNLSRNFINQVECGKKNLSDRSILDICEVFDVNEEWLRTGNGEMFLPINQEKELAKLTVDFLKSEPESFRRRVIAYLAKMTDEQWKMVEDMVDELAKK
jgi:transcriptional regulator with XRE-family HTH domain